VTGPDAPTGITVEILIEKNQILPGRVFSVHVCSANIGVFTLCAAKQGAHIYGYEPIPQTFEVLEHNIYLHSFRCDADIVAQALILHFLLD
jgi:hypothetical protein